MPRRLLLIGDSVGDAPDTLSLGDAVTPDGSPPVATMPLLQAIDEEAYLREKHLLRIEHEGRWIELAMGLRHAGEVHWWEACRLVEDQDTPTCRVVTMGGAIPHKETARADIAAGRGITFDLLHRHNWLYGTLHVRMHSNGVCEVFARHENNMAVDSGQDLPDCVPVIGIRATGATDQACGSWSGDRDELRFSDVRVDVREAARLATEEEPGRLDAGDEEVLIWQPYEAVSIFSGNCMKMKTGDPWFLHGKERLFPRGVARSVQFNISLSDKSPRVARYVAPYWWYGLTEELTTRPFLPVSNEWDEQIDHSVQWVRDGIHQRGFEDGSVPRGTGPYLDEVRQRHEPGWEGEIPYIQFIHAYRTADAMDYANAMRSAYHFTDIAIDHASKVARMHGFWFPAYALPMNRVQACIAAYLETGDPYMIDTAEAVIEGAFRLHRNSWPRTAMGRDACFIRGALMLYRYFNNEHFCTIARKAAHDLAEVQRENGSFGDQGGGTGIHQWGAYITKPWMGLLATMPLMDCLELFPDDDDLKQCCIRFGDWLLANRWERDGIVGWSYQHDFNGRPRHYDFYTQKWLDLPAQQQWHQESLGRLLAFCTMQTGNNDYLDAWARARETKKWEGNDHYNSTVLQFMPWLQMHLWQPTWENGELKTKPLDFGERMPREATVMTPNGDVEVMIS